MSASQKGIEDKSLAPSEDKAADTSKVETKAAARVGATEDKTDDDGLVPFKLTAYIGDAKPGDTIRVTPQQAYDWTPSRGRVED